MNAENKDRAEPDRPLHGVDLEAVLAVAGGDRRLLRELLKSFLDEIPVLIRAVGEAIDQRDAAGLEDAAHKLKGVVRYLHMDLAFEQAYRLELVGRESGNWQEAKGVFQNLRERVDDALRVLTDFMEQRQQPG